MLRKKLIQTAMLTIAISSTAVYANNVEKNIDSKTQANIAKEILMGFSGGDLSVTKGVSIDNMKQIGDSSNYIFKYSVNGSSHSMIYFRDIDSVLIESNGSMIDFKKQESIFNDYNASFVKPILNEIDKSHLLSFNVPDDKIDPNNKPVDLYVFSDPTCGYCKKLHREIEDYTNNNMNIHYLPFPRSGLAGEGYDMLVNSYCATNPKEAFTEAKNKHVIPDRKENLTEAELKDCQDYVEKYYKLGGEIGVAGTPAIYTSNGYKVGGYVPAAQLKYIIQGK